MNTQKHQRIMDYLLQHNLAFCWLPSGEFVTYEACIKALGLESDTTMDDIFKEMKELNI